MSCGESNRNDAIALVCYGIFSEGKWYSFDAKGNELAKALIEKTKKSDHIKATVEGAFASAPGTSGLAETVRVLKPRGVVVAIDSRMNLPIKVIHIFDTVVATDPQKLWAAAQ